MKQLLKLADGIDWFNEKISWLATWAVMFAALISAGNATVRYLIDKSSNGWLEIQWYLFAVTVMLGTSYVLRKNEHVRVDIFYMRFKGNGKALIDLFGLVFFLMPVVFTMLYLSWPLFVKMYVTNEASSNAGGLIRWPAMLTLPLGFGLLLLQGVSEILKRIGFLMHLYELDAEYERPVQ